jgi:formate dehydrogenase major subunit
MYSGVDKIFGIGDFRRGPATAIEAIADGRKAAQAIDAQFGGNMEKLYTESFRERNVARGHLIRPDHVNKLKNVMRSLLSNSDNNATDIEAQLEHVLKQVMRNKMSELNVDDRHLSFNEVETGYSHQAAIDEAKRCLSCGCHDGNDCKLRHYATDYHVDKQLIISGLRPISA